MKGGWVYIMTNKRNGTLYVGVTSNIFRRVWQHQHKESPGFTAKYGLTKLVYLQEHGDIRCRFVGARLRAIPRAGSPASGLLQFGKPATPFMNAL